MSKEAWQGKFSVIKSKEGKFKKKRKGSEGKTLCVDGEWAFCAEHS